MHADDPRERLRRYLEQRRELGESELVLDTLDVHDVLRLIGAGAQGRARGEATSRPPESQRDRAPRPQGDSDWRSELRAAGAEPGAAKAPPAKPVTPRRAFPPPPTDEPAAPAGEAVAGLVVGATASRAIAPEIASLPDLAAIAATTAGCTRCPLYSTAQRAVPGEGNPDADFMIVGEAPGATEDETGRPFVGESGQLLTKIIEAINLSRDDVFIANVIKHRPPANRNPKDDEIAACSPYLLRQIELVRPKVILAVGTFAAQTLLGTSETLTKLRGRVHEYHGVPLIVTYHPAALLRNPAWKRPTWEDVQLARRVLDRAAGA